MINLHRNYMAIIDSDRCGQYANRKRAEAEAAKLSRTGQRHYAMLTTCYRYENDVGTYLPRVCWYIRISGGKAMDVAVACGDIS